MFIEEMDLAPLSESMMIALGSGTWMDEFPAGKTQSRGPNLQWRFRRSLQSASIRTLRCTSADEAAAAAREARYSDLVVLLRPDGGGSGGRRRRMFEGLLFGSGRPLLLVPPDWVSRTFGARVVIAWNGGREAVRALAGAQPFLWQAQEITVVAVADLKEQVDEDLRKAKEHLARRGLACRVRFSPRSHGRTVDALLEACASEDADLVVMGGYGRLPISELAFGGVTRTMAHASPVPLLLAH